MHARYINLSTRKSIACRLLFSWRIKPRCRRFVAHSAKPLYHSLSLPHLTAAVTRLSHRRPLSAPCPRAPRKISRIRIFSLKIALPTKPCPSNSHCPKAIDAPQRTRERRTHPCTALEILQSLTTLTKPSRPTLTYKTCVGVPSIQHRLRRPSSTAVNSVYLSRAQCAESQRLISGADEPWPVRASVSDVGVTGVVIRLG